MAHHLERSRGVAFDGFYSISTTGSGLTYFPDSTEEHWGLSTITKRILIMWPHHSPHILFVGLLLACFCSLVLLAVAKSYRTTSALI